MYIGGGQNLSTIIYAYLIPFIGLIFLIFLIKMNHLFNKEQSRLFIISIVINLILIIVTSTDYIISKQINSPLWMVRRITSFLNFAISPLIPILLIKIFKQKKDTIIFYLPFLINFIICFFSMFIKIIFFIDINNYYERGCLFFMPSSIVLLYILIFIINPVTSHVQEKRMERIIVTSIAVTIIVGLLLEIFYYYHFLSYGFSALGLIIYYILQNINFFSKDSLTGAYNRQMYNYMLDKINNSLNCVIALLDINNFKYINDNYGHDEGDKVLILFVNIINKNIKDIASFYRTGGDEFMLISTKVTEDVLLNALNKSKIELEKYDLSFACGVSEYNKEDNLEEILHMVDKKMYINKNQIKNQEKE